MVVLRVFKSLSFLLALVFAFSVLTVEPGHVQGYENDDFPAFVESDSVFAVCGMEFAVPIGCFDPVESVVVFVHFRPALPPLISCNPYRGPPTISFIA
jgi:hypothetical protein